MQDLIAKGVSWFEEQRKLHMAVNVEYRGLGTLVPVTVPATIGGSRFEAADASGQIIRYETRDFFVSVSDWPEAPVRGDRITETDADGVKRVYEVSLPAGAGNPWQWGDRSQRVRRIHTSLVRVDRPQAPAPTVPGAPTITSAIDGSSATWSAPASDGGSPITGYKLYINGVWDQAAYEPQDLASVDVVLAGQVLQVSAVNAVGEGPKSAAVTVA